MKRIDFHVKVIKIYRFLKWLVCVWVPSPTVKLPSKGSHYTLLVRWCHEKASTSKVPEMSKPLYLGASAL